MSFANLGLKNLGGNIARSVYSSLPFPGIERPVFIIGCGRSGTTILGATLAQHQLVTYLNEPCHLWFSAYPETDIWTPKACCRGGKLVLTPGDVEPRKSHRISRLFRLETLVSGKPILIEKLPANNFRLNFIRRIFPDARFIHIYRNGLEVARSIDTISRKGRWFGTNSYKWDRLTEYAGGQEETKSLPALCTSFYEKGLLEWRLSVEAAVEFLSGLPDEAFFEISYDELVEEPVETVTRVLGFVGVECDSEVRRFVSEKLARKTPRLGACEVSEKERTLGGKLLPLSMDGGKGLTKRSAGEASSAFPGATATAQGAEIESEPVQIMEK